MWQYVSSENDTTIQNIVFINTIWYDTIQYNTTWHIIKQYVTIIQIECYYNDLYLSLWIGQWGRKIGKKRGWGIVWATTKTVKSGVLWVLIS